MHSLQVESTTDDITKEITQKAFSSNDEKEKIKELIKLRGVGYAFASAMLHWFAKDKYPILDFRALWSCSSSKKPPYSFSFWWEYTKFCRKIAAKNNITMRTLDRALWQYSKEKQPSPPKQNE